MIVFLKMINKGKVPPFEANNYNFILIGHSIGAYICLKVAHRNPDFNVKYIVNLFPTIRHLWSGLAPAIKLFILPGFRHSAAALIHHCPFWIQKNLFAMGIGGEPSQKFLSVLDKLQYNTVLNILYMANTEASTVIQIDDELKSFIGTRGDITLFLYGHKDPYTPKHFTEELKSAFPNANVFMTTDVNVEHAFCVASSEVIATQTFDLFKQLNWNLENTSEQ